MIDDAVKTVVMEKTIFEEGKFAITASERGGLHELCFERTQHDLLLPQEANGEEDYEELIVRSKPVTVWFCSLPTSWWQRVDFDLEINQYHTEHKASGLTAVYRFAPRCTDSIADIDITWSDPEGWSQDST